MSIIDGEMFDPADVRSILSELEITAKNEADEGNGDLLRRAAMVIENQQRLLDELNPRPFNNVPITRRLSARFGSR